MTAKYSNQKEKINLEQIQQAAQEIKRGNLVLFPTETVYGIGANATDEKAVGKIFKAKQRAQDNPLIVHVSNLQMVEDIIERITPLEKKLIEKFWPGPLTIIFKRKSEKILPNNVTANLDTVGIRMPSNCIARELIQAAGVPIAAPSANVSGKPSGTAVEDIIEELKQKVSYILDGGSSDIGLESTVIKVEGNKVIILRPGKVTKEQLQEVAQSVEIDSHVLGKVENHEKVASPGMKYRHYAPSTQCMMIYSKNAQKMIEKINKTTQEMQKQGKKVLVLGKKEHLEQYIANRKWDMGSTLEQIAKNIFTLLRKVDKEKVDIVVIEGVGEEKLGLAITNRLIRACSYHYIIV